MNLMLYKINRKERKANSAGPRLSAHVIRAGILTQIGVAARPLRTMGVSPERSAEAAVAEIAAYSHAS